MTPDEQPADPPDGDDESADEDLSKQRGPGNAGHERIWDSPIGTGDPIPFDPTKFAPPLSKEELEKMLEDDKP